MQVTARTVRLLATEMIGTDRLASLGRLANVPVAEPIAWLSAVNRTCTVNVAVDAVVFFSVTAASALRLVLDTAHDVIVAAEFGSARPAVDGEDEDGRSLCVADPRWWRAPVQSVTISAAASRITATRTGPVPLTHAAGG